MVPSTSTLSPKSWRRYQLLIESSVWARHRSATARVSASLASLVWPWRRGYAIGMYNMAELGAEISKLAESSAEWYLVSWCCSISVDEWNQSTQPLSHIILVPKQLLPLGILHLASCRLQFAVRCTMCSAGGTQSESRSFTSAKAFFTRAHIRFTSFLFSLFNSLSVDGSGQPCSEKSTSRVSRLNFGNC